MTASKARAKRSKRTSKKAPPPPDWGPHFLNALRCLGHVTRACEEVDVGRRTVYQRRDTDDAFRAEWDQIVEDRHAFDDEKFEELKRELALVLIEQATHGVERLKVSGGEVVRYGGKPIVERHFSPALQVFLAQALLGWKTTQRTELTGKDGEPIKLEDGRARLDELLQRHARAASAPIGDDEAGGADGTEDGGEA